MRESPPVPYCSCSTLAAREQREVGAAHADMLRDPPTRMCSCVSWQPLSFPFMPTALSASGALLASTSLQQLYSNRLTCMLAAPASSRYSKIRSWKVPLVRSTATRYSFAPGRSPSYMGKQRQELNKCVVHGLESPGHQSLL